MTYMAETTDLMTIGQFSSLSRLSVRMLRHYDALTRPASSGALSLSVPRRRH